MGKFLLGFLLFFFFSTSHIFFAEDISPSISALNILTSVSAFRSNRDNSLLEEDPVLTRTAQKYADLMVEQNHFSHLGPDGRRGVDRAKVEGGTWVTLGEVIGIGPDINAILSAWMQSTPHREMILDKRWNYGGAGLASRGDEILCVVLFAETECLILQVEEHEEYLLLETNNWYKSKDPKDIVKESEIPYYFVEVRGKRFLQTRRTGRSPLFVLPKNLFENKITLLRFGITYSLDPWEGKIYHHFLF